MSHREPVAGENRWSKGIFPLSGQGGALRVRVKAQGSYPLSYVNEVAAQVIFIAATRVATRSIPSLQKEGRSAPLSFYKR